MNSENEFHKPDRIFFVTFTVLGKSFPFALYELKNALVANLRCCQKYNAFVFQKSLAILIILISVLTASAQLKFDWAVQMGGADDDQISGVVMFEDGVYATGTFQGIMQLGNSQAESNGNEDIFIVKSDRDGYVSWVRSLGGKYRDEGPTIQKGDRHIFVGGEFSGNIKAGGKVFEGDGLAIAISSWDLDGNLEWLTRFPYSAPINTIDVIQYYPDGSVMAGGMLLGTMNTEIGDLQTSGQKLAWQVWIDPSGKVQRTHLSSGSGSHRLKDVELDEDGNQYLYYSTTAGIMNFDKGNYVALKRGTDDALILVKLDKEDNFLWGKAFSSTAFCEDAGLAVGIDQEVQVCLNFNGELSAVDTLIDCKSQSKSVLFSFDTNGNLRWIQPISSSMNSRELDALCDKDGNTLLTGGFRRSFTVEDETYTASSGYYNLNLLKFDRDGKLVWYDVPAEGETNFVKSIALDKDGNIYLGGGMMGKIDMKGESMESLGIRDVFLAKYFNCEQLDIQITEMKPLCKGQTGVLSVQEGFESYIWNGDEDGDSIYRVSKPGIYTIDAYSKQGCMVTDTVDVVSVKIPDLGLLSEISLYPGEVKTIKANSGFVNYNWDDGTMGQERDIEWRTAMESEVLVLSGQIENGCVASDTIIIKFMDAPEANEGLLAYPNPASSNLYWKYAGKSKGVMQVKLTDIKGRLRYYEEVDEYAGNIEKSINMNNLPTGSYILTIQEDEVVVSEIVIKQ